MTKNSPDVQHPILISCCVHGNERVGEYVYQNYSFGESSWALYEAFIANELALKKNVRFIDCDLNRAFPGNNQTSQSEPNLAYNILQVYGSQYDTLIDIHQTFAIQEPIAIIRAQTPMTARILSYTNIQFVIDESYGTKTPTGNQITHLFRDGICLEFPQMTGPQEAWKIVRPIMENILNAVTQSNEQRYYHVSEAINAMDGIPGLINLVKLTKVQKAKIGLNLVQEYRPVFLGETSYQDLHCLLISPNL